MKQKFADPLAQNPQLTEGVSPDRVFYATGVLLGAEDFQAEQLYHRSRLARALRYLHGSGTVAGLRVDWVKPLEAGEEFPQGREEELIVQPGLAIDRLGRLIEVPKSACIRLDRWFKSQSETDVKNSFHDAPYNGVIVDVFIRFVSCDRGKTPAFAAGPFDALDAVTPSRIRDGYQLELILRQKGVVAVEETLPESQWKNAPFNALTNLIEAADTTERQNRLNQNRKSVQDAILTRWKEGTEEWDENGLVPFREHLPGQDTSSLFLARLVLPATQAESGKITRQLGVEIILDNYSRQFVYAAPALARWLGI